MTVEVRQEGIDEGTHDRESSSTPLDPYFPESSTSWLSKDFKRETVLQTIEKIEEAMERYSLSSTYVDSKLVEKSPAEALAVIKIDDPNLQFTLEELQNPSDEVLSLAVPLVLAKAEIAKKENPLTKKGKEAISKLTNQVFQLIGGRKNTARALAAVTLLATACSRIPISAEKPTPVETLISSITSSPTAEPTKTPTEVPTETPTPTETLTPTKIPLDIYYNFSGFEEGKWKMPEESEIPEISYDDITSGKLLERELSLLSGGEITPFTGEEVPLDDSLSYNDLGEIRFVDLNLLVQNPGYYLDNPEKVPLRVTSLSFVDLDGTRLLVFGVAMRESDGSVVILHYAFQNYKDQFVINMIQAAVNRKASVLPCGFVHKPYYEGLGWYDYNKEPFMLERYQDKEGIKEREELIKRWLETRKAPEELQKLLLLGFIGPWDPYRQHDIKPKS
jgi:hypothetical protein